MYLDASCLMAYKVIFQPTMNSRDQGWGPMERHQSAVGSRQSAVGSRQSQNKATRARVKETSEDHRTKAAYPCLTPWQRQAIRSGDSKSRHQCR